MFYSWTGCTRGIFHKFAPGWSEQDGQGEAEIGWSRRVSQQSKPTYQRVLTHYSVLRPFRLILRDLGSDRVLVSFVFIYQVIIYFIIFYLLNVNIFINVFATSRYLSVDSQFV